MDALNLTECSVRGIMLQRSNLLMIDSGLSAKPVLKSPHPRLSLYPRRTRAYPWRHPRHAPARAECCARCARAGPAARRNFDVLGATMPPFILPDTTTLDEQMRNPADAPPHFALLVNACGSARRRITLEDIPEEIVGGISDEHHAAALARTVQSDPPMDGAMTVCDLNRALDWSAPDNEANTVARLVIRLARSIARPGHGLSFHGCGFGIVPQHDSRIIRLRLRPLDDPGGALAQ